MANCSSCVERWSTRLLGKGGPCCLCSRYGTEGRCEAPHSASETLGDEEPHRKNSGVGNGNRTRNRRSHSPVLCQLSYSHRRHYYSNFDDTTALGRCQEPKPSPSAEVITPQLKAGSIRSRAGESGWKTISRKRETRNYRERRRPKRRGGRAAARARPAVSDWQILRSQILGNFVCLQT
jgi:hypothetical protein